jgi:hypothetical protein
MPEDKDEKPRKGRPPRELGIWTNQEHKVFMKMYEAMYVGFNLESRDIVDKNATDLIEYVNKARGF